MPIEVISSASAPFSASSRPTCGPTNSTRCSFAVLSSAVSRLHDGLRQLGAVLARLERHADQHVARGAEVLHRIVVVAAGVERPADLVDFGGMLVADLHHRAAGELDREIQALGGEEEHCEQEGDERHHVERQRVAHEGDVAADLEEFHAAYFQAVLPIATPSSFLREP